MNHPNALPIGTILKSQDATYEILSVIGAGGFGITYRVKGTVKIGNITVNATFAIKEHFINDYCSRELTTSKVVFFDNHTDAVNASLKDFISEAKRLQQIGASLNNIVKVNEVFEANNTAYYVMEYLEGVSIAQYVAKNGPMNPTEAVRLLMPVFEAVARLHQQRITHLDIKPQNIMITDGSDGQPRPVLIDFGLAKHYDKKGNATSTLRGGGYSEGYAPVEQYKGITTFSPTADIYALAATLLFCLTGKNPPSALDCDTADIAQLLPPTLPPTMRNGILNAMTHRPENRTKSVEEFISAVRIPGLNDLPIGQATQRVTQPVASKYPSLPNFKWRQFTIGLGIIGVLIAVIYIAWPTNPDKKLSAAEAYRLGMMYLEKENFGDSINTDSIPMEVENAIRYLTVAADKGYRDANVELGNIYSGEYNDDILTPFAIDGEKALKYYEAAGDYGNMAKIYFVGHGQWDDNEIIDRVKSLEESGLSQLGISSDGLTIDYGIDRDGAKADECLERLINTKGEQHFDLRGLIHEYGIGVPVDYRKAAAYYRVFENPSMIESLIEKLNREEIYYLDNPVNGALACLRDTSFYGGTPLYLTEKTWPIVKKRWGDNVVKKIGVYLTDNTPNEFQMEPQPTDGYVIALNSSIYGKESAPVRDKNSTINAKGNAPTTDDKARCMTWEMAKALTDNPAKLKELNRLLSFYGGSPLNGTYLLRFSKNGGHNVYRVNSSGLSQSSIGDYASFCIRYVYPYNSWKDNYLDPKDYRDEQKK